MGKEGEVLYSSISDAADAPELTRLSIYLGSAHMIRIVAFSHDYIMMDSGMVCGGIAHHIIIGSIQGIQIVTFQVATCATPLRQRKEYHGLCLI